MVNLGWFTWCKCEGEIMMVLMDYREQGERISDAQDYFEDIEVLELPVGDYIFNDVVVFEYKTFDDFISSIIDKRVFNQSLNQMEEFKYHFIILELGVGFDLRKRLTNRYYKSGVPVTPKQYYAAISRLNTYTTVLPVNGDSLECFQVMESQAEKCLDDKTLVKQYHVKTGNSALNYLCNNIRGVGLVTGETITDGLGLECLEDLLRLDKESLVSVNGVGDKTAENIL